MKKLFLSIAAIAALFATSCVQSELEDAQVAAGGEGLVTFTITNPQSRATEPTIADGTKATALVCGVYDADWKYLTSVDGEFLNGSLTTTIEIRLVNKKTYNFVFWAQAPGAPYTLDLGTVGVVSEPEITVSYDGAEANDELRDAFFGQLPSITVDGTMNLDVTLRRPFAQVNFATDDTELARIGGFDITATNATTSFTTNVYTTLSLKDGSVDGLVEKTFAAAALPAEDLYLLADTGKTGKAYDWLTMNYVLAAADESSLAVCTMVVTDGDGETVTVKYPQAPVKRNYRTTLIGSLLTDQVNIEVKIDPIFEKPEYVNATGFYVEGGVYHIQSAKGMDYFRDQVNAGNAEVQNAKVVLDADIDLSATRTQAAWTPIGTAENPFKGTFDGQNYTVSNFSVNQAGYAGLFGNVYCGVVKNVKVENVSIVANHYAGAVVGKGYVNIDNCHAENVTITLSIDTTADGGKGDYGDKAGAILGQNGEGKFSVTNCSAKGVTIKGYRDLGGIVGMAHYGNTVSGCSVENTTIEQDITGEYKNELPETLGWVIGRPGVSGSTTVTEVDNTPADQAAADAKSVVIKFAVKYIPIKDAEGNEVGAAYDPESATTDAEGNTVYTTIVVTANEGLAWLDEKVEAGDNFASKTVKLDTDIIIPDGETWEPIGDNRTDSAFSGVFDGQNHLISGAKKSSFDGAVYGSKEGWGIFSVLDGATVKNLKLDNEVFASYTVISGTVAGYAKDTTFENIEISNTKISGYNWYTGGVVGWASGNCTFKDIKLDETVSVGTLWDSHGQNAGGIAGGVSGSGTYLIEDCEIACVLDVINDVTSNYKWYLYRIAGMIIGNTNTTEEIWQTVVTATATNVTCKNVTVTYGKWMNYHYCEEYGNRGWGRVENTDYVGFGIPAEHTHSDGKEHYVCIPFDQLFGGGQNGSGHYPVKGLATFPGVTVNYPAEYTCPLCGEKHNVK